MNRRDLLKNSLAASVATLAPARVFAQANPTGSRDAQLIAIALNWSISFELCSRARDPDGIPWIVTLVHRIPCDVSSRRISGCAAIGDFAGRSEVILQRSDW